MDDMGLPVAFGKQLPPKPATTAAAPAGGAQSNGESSRGGATGRGSRGIVGGGKKSRGRGRGGGGNHVPKYVSGSNAEVMGEANSSKRSLEAMQASQETASIPPIQQETFGWSGLPDRPMKPSPMDFSGHRGDGGHRGAGRGGGGSGGGGHQPPERGFYQPSFVEDPWKELMEARGLR